MQVKHYIYRIGIKYGNTCKVISLVRGFFVQFCKRYCNSAMVIILEQHIDKWLVFSMEPHWLCTHY